MEDLDAAGYALADLTLAAAQCDHMAASLPAASSGRGGVRNLISHPTVVQLLLHQSLGGYLWSLCGRDLVAVSATLLDRTAETSWRVQWHQDRAITVREKLEVAGYGPWSSRAGSIHVEPPAEVLMQMLAVRVHLDDSGADSGALRVIPGSHRFGKLGHAAMNELVRDQTPVQLCVGKGSILAVRPLLVHASSVPQTVLHRRVLHLEFAPLEAIWPLRWQTAVHLRRAA